MADDILQPKKKAGPLSPEARPTEAQFVTKTKEILSDPALTPTQRVAAANAYAEKTGYKLKQEDLANASKITPTKTDSEGEEIVVQARSEFAASDHRVRLSAFSGQAMAVYGPMEKNKNLLAPLHTTNGLLFPYTPTISVSQDTSWVSADIEHANYDVLSFQKAASANISINAKFTVQNQREGAYMMAAIHYLRTVSKSYFGEKDADRFELPEGSEAQIVERNRIEGRAGLPPPVLILSGYGQLLFNNLRVVVKGHSWSFDENSDMIKVDLPVGQSVWLPPILQISISLGMQSIPQDVRKSFSLDEFRTGTLLNSSKKGWF